MTKVLLIGKAKTGTTVVSKTIQNSLSNCDYELEPKSAGFFTQDRVSYADNLMVKVIFEHFNSTPNVRQAILSNELPLKFNKKILLIRDPRDELISRLCYMVRPLHMQGRMTPEKLQQWLHCIHKKEQSPSQVSFLSLVNDMDSIFQTSKFVEGFLEFCNQYTHFIKLSSKDVFSLKYEDFIDGNFDKLEQYLGFKLSRELINTSENQPSNQDELIQRTKRSSSYGGWKEFLTEDDVVYLKPLLSDMLDDLGYTDWQLNASNSLDPINYSTYIDKLVEFTPPETEVQPIPPNLRARLTHLIKHRLLKQQQ